MMTTKIKFNADLNEYTVKVWINGKRVSSCDYFTNDRQDAKDTEKAMLINFNDVKENYEV